MPASRAPGGALLRVGRGAVLAAGTALLVLFLVGLGLWGYHAHEVLPRLVAPGSWTAPQLRAVLDGWGVPENWWVAYFVLLELLLAGVGAVAAAVVLRGPVTWFRLYLALCLVLFGTMSGAVPMVFGAVGLGDSLNWLQGLAWLTLFPLAYVFPDGRFVPSWTRWCAVGWLLYGPYVVVLGLFGVSDQSAVATMPLLALFASAAAAAVYRYVRVASPEQRRQVRWVVVAFALRFVYSLVFLVTPLGQLQDEVSPRGLLTYALTMGVSYAVAAVLPLAVVAAIVWHRLYDIDVWLNRALVYGGLTAFVVGGYALVVAGVGAAWPADDTRLSPLLATVLVAVAFHPVRERLQRASRRLVYGRRAEPYAVVAELGRRLGTALPPDAVLQTMVETIGPALRLRYAHAALTGEPGVTYPPSAPAPVGETVTFPLRSHGEELGTLTVAPRPGEPLTANERHLLAEVTRQAGIAVNAATLTTALRRSRERIVTAREEERRRLHRDLHDGLGPTLASTFQRVDAARTLLRTDPGAAEALLTDVGTQTRTAIADIRRVVYSLRPPALDELGLVAALEQECTRLNPRPDTLTLTLRAAPLPPLPAVVEVAAYRIVTEAVTNVLRHAQAGSAAVALTVVDDSLLVEVTDDGTGIAARSGTGVGLGSMRERAQEIGGSLSVASAHPQGTVIRARLPLTIGSGE